MNGQAGEALIEPQRLAAVQVRRRRDNPFAQRIERCWAWLEHWGHPVEHVDLDAVPRLELMDMAFESERRVKVLAENWSSWW